MNDNPPLSPDVLAVIDAAFEEIVTHVRLRTIGNFYGTLDGWPHGIPSLRHMDLPRVDAFEDMALAREFDGNDVRNVLTHRLQAHYAEIALGMGGDACYVLLRELFGMDTCGLSVDLIHRVAHAARGYEKYKPLEGYIDLSHIDLSGIVMNSHMLQELPLPLCFDFCCMDGVHVRETGSFSMRAQHSSWEHSHLGECTITGDIAESCFNFSDVTAFAHDGELMGVTNSRFEDAFICRDAAAAAAALRALPDAAWPLRDDSVYEVLMELHPE